MTIGAARPPHRLRLRLTLLYGLLSILSGAGLLLLIYVLSQRIDDRPAWVFPEQGRPVVPVPTPRIDPGDLLDLPVLALAIMALISLGVGWMVAGRMLRPVQVMTERLQGISERNVHERLAVAGPRDELKDLADTVDGLLERLDGALEAQKRFVANAAHELRTPLTVEHALLEEPLIDPDATLESFRANFERLLAVSAQRARLLESLLTLAGSERGRERSEPIDLAAVAGHALAQRRAALERLGLVAEVALEPAPVVGDPPLVERLVANLCDNAVHHNVPGGRIEVRTGRVAARSVLTIANSGRKLQAHEVERLFEPFQRLERTADDHHHGLGLSIVRAIANAHGATVSAHPGSAGGLILEIGFPLVSPATAGRRRHPAPS
jgi:signal transduction histidine kinase